MSLKFPVRVTPKTGLLDIPLSEVVRYRGMIRMLVKRNYQVQNKQMVLGPIWIIGETVISSGLFSFVFGTVGHFQSDGIPYFLFFLLGNTLWNLLSACTSKNANVFMENSYLFGKVYFPRLTVPLANMLYELIPFCIRFVVCMIIWAFSYARGEVGFGGWYFLLIPVLVIQTALLGVSVGMLISSLTTKYRDLHHAVTLGLQLLMYTAPIVYPTAQLPAALQRYVLLNPVSSVVELFRFCVIGSGTVHWGAWVYSLLLTAVLVLGSLILFNQVEKTFIDIV